MNLSAQQKRAVERLGQDVCVVAGPGSGKTRVLVERFAWLVEQQRVEPEAILAITFTEKAAVEIKQRLVKRFATVPEVRESIERAWVSTIDGFCARLLQAHAIAARLPPDFRVLDQPSADRIAREAAESALQQLYEERPVEMRQMLEAVDLATGDDRRQSDLAAALLEICDSMRLAGSREIAPRRQVNDMFAEARALAQSIVAAQVRGEDGGRLREWALEFLSLEGPVKRRHLEVLARFDFNLNKLAKNAEAKALKQQILPALESQWLSEMYSGLGELLADAIGRVDRAYREAKRRQASVDFADLAERTIELLESGDEDVRESCARFEHVLMDELQDTNPLQWRLVKLVCGAGSMRARFFGVGDVNQSIYGFRHAEPAGFAQYRKKILDSGGTVDELDENYRSRQEILDAVSRMVHDQGGIEPRPLTAKRTDFTEAGGPVVELLVGQGDSPEETEAAMVAARIRELVDNEGFKFSRIALLLRSLNAAEPFEQAFDRFGIPFVVAGGRTFLEARETRDLLALLAALVNPLDEIALLTVLRSPLMGVADEEIFRRGREGWQRVFEERFGLVRRLAGIQPPDLLIGQVLDECGYAVELPERARSNIDKFLAWLRREHNGRPRPLAEMLEDIEALRSARGEPEAPPPESGNVVRIMTVHAAKGLEFPVVFLGAIHRGVNNDAEPLLFSAEPFSPEQGLGIRWRNPVTGVGVPDAAHRALRETWKHRSAEEENRLLYVAMTRAEDRLILSHAQAKKSRSWQKLAARAIPDVMPAEAPPVPALVGPGSPVDQPAPELLDPPDVSGQYDSYVTVSEVATFSTCPRRYFLDSYLGLEPEPEGHGTGVGTGAMALGRETHRALSGEAVDSAEALELKARFDASELGRRAVRAQRAEREFDFLLHCEDVIVGGQIDLWFEEGKELVVVDYKTDRDESNRDAYALQLRLYALALERYAGRKADRAVLFYLRSGREVEIDLSTQRPRDAQSRVHALRDAQASLQFPLTEGEHCAKCQFYGKACPAGRG